MSYDGGYVHNVQDDIDDVDSEIASIMGINLNLGEGPWEDLVGVDETGEEAKEEDPKDDTGKDEASGESPGFGSSGSNGGEITLLSHPVKYVEEKLVKEFSKLALKLDDRSLSSASPPEKELVFDEIVMERRRTRAEKRSTVRIESPYKRHNREDKQRNKGAKPLSSLVKRVRTLMARRAKAADPTMIALDLMLDESRSSSPTSATGHRFGIHGPEELLCEPAAVECDQCFRLVYRALIRYCMCRDCKFTCHVACMKNITMVCPKVQLGDNPTFIMDVRPMIGLEKQKYRCGECKKLILMAGLWAPSRICDYTGLFYCDKCHKNDLSVIPARIIKNGDWGRYPVCRGSLLLLRYAKSLQIFDVEDLNKSLIDKPQMKMVHTFRQRLHIMRGYLIECKFGLTMLRGTLAHMTRVPQLYTLQQLEDVNDGYMGLQLRKMSSKWGSHIRTCFICRPKGLLCEYCKNREKRIYRFQSNFVKCQLCLGYFHEECWDLDQLVCRMCTAANQKYRLSIPNDQKL